VRVRPDVRTIRYYGTLGLIDPPPEMTGRSARYGGRHLLQQRWDRLHYPRVAIIVAGFVLTLVAGTVA
jgi:hypothetical protein